MNQPTHSLILAILMAGTTSALHAGWSRDPSNNTVIVQSMTNTYSSVDLCADGRGGAFLAWKQTRSSGLTYYRAQVQQINANGELVWPLGALPITGLTSSQLEVALSPSIVDNCLVAWIVPSSVGSDAYVQRIQSPGQIPAFWPSNGVNVNATFSNKTSVMVVSDGSGGAIVGWCDLRMGDWRGFARRVDVNGTIAWGPPWSGMPFSTNAVYEPRMIANGHSGALLTWARYPRYGSTFTHQIFAQQLNAYGATMWPSNGVQVGWTTNVQGNAAMAIDSSRNAFVAWDENRGSGSAIYAQRITTNGECLWSSVGVLVATSAPPQSFPCLLADGTGTVIVAYQANTDLYIQRMNSFGQPTWGLGGVQLSALGNYDDHQKIVATSAGDYIVVWRSDRGDDWIVAQKINAAGQVQWTPNGINVGRADAGSDPRVTADKSGGAIIAWEGTYGGTNAIKIQRINADGSLGGSAAGSAGWELLLLE